MTRNTPPGSSAMLPTAPWAQQPGRADTPTSLYSNNNSPVIGAPISPTTSTSSNPRVGAPSRSTSPTPSTVSAISVSDISSISPNNSSQPNLPSFQYQTTPPRSPTTLSHSRLSSSQNQMTPPNNPNFIISKWGIGWETPTIMISCYLLSLATALLHLFLFIYISDKNAEGLDRVAPQTYISTASNILANAFSFFLKTALATAFVQYLWHLLRVQTMKVSTIDTLFGLKSNVFQMFTGAAIRATPVLCILSIIMTSMTVAVSFPPGAINVISVQRTSYNSVVVPTFNASFMGNGSGWDANQYSLATLSPVTAGFASSGLLSGKHSNLLTRLAFQTMITGQAFDQTSPCGANCSFVVEFEGPTLECNSSSANITSSFYSNLTNSSLEFTIYSGNWSDLTLAPTIAHVRYNGTYSNAHWQSTTLKLLDTEIQINNDNLHNETSIINTTVTQDNLYCTPGRALYTVNNTYVSNILTRNITTTPISALTNLILTSSHNNVAIVPGFTNASGITTEHGFGTTPANWSAAALDYYRDLNMMTIFDTMFYYLAGEFTAAPAVVLDLNVERATDAISDKGWGESTPTFGDADAGTLGTRNGTIISRTPLNTAFSHYTLNSSANPSFILTQETLNALLQNITLSTSLSYSLWNTTTNTTIHTTQNIYTFSQPLNLLLPYFLSLAISLPFLFLGFWALIKMA